MSTVDDFTAAAVLTSLRRMFRPDGWFDICAVDACLKALNRIPPSEDYDRLRVLHCVSWRDMVPGLREEVMQRTLALLAHPGFRFEDLQDRKAQVAAIVVETRNGSPGLLSRLLGRAQ